MSEENPLISTWLTGVYYNYIKGSAIDRFFEFSRFDAKSHHLGLYQFETMCFAVLIVFVVSIFVVFGTKNLSRFPRKIQGFFELVVEGLRNLIAMLMGEGSNKYVPYLGTLFIFILLMNLTGLIPLFRSPTMVLSITLALGIFSFLYVQYSGMKANGVLGHFKHFCGPVIFLAPLFIIIEPLGEIIKPFSLSLRLYGNIFGEDNVIEQLLALGGGNIPLHLPILFFAVFTSFLQAFIFVALTSIYIKLMTSHDEH